MVSIPTRYPADLSRMSVEYNKAKTKEILKTAKEEGKLLYSI
jgi:hypothetical protein